MKQRFTLLAVLSLGFLGLRAQSSLFIDTSYTAEQMVMDFFANSCATPSNVTYNGAPATMAFFEGANTSLGVNAGIVISSGDVTQLANPVGTFASTGFMTAGDPDLQNLVTGLPSFDAAVLEFDLTVADDGDLNFQYVFGSEEYPEFAGSSFNDVFGFFISGLGAISNIAQVPGANIPVSINNVNATTNSQYYVDNEASSDPNLALDGMTTPLLATFTAVGGNTYHVKIGVTDIADGIFDSGVFIGIESLCGDSLLTPPAQAIAAVTGNTVTFDNQSRYATAWHWDFGDGTTSNERFPGPHNYAANGVYTVTLTTQNWCCTDTYSFTVQVGNASGAGEAAQRPFTISPNPATDWLQLTTNGQPVDYQLLDLAGKAVLQGTATADRKLDISGLAPGAYLFFVKNEAGSFAEKVMVR